MLYHRRWTACRRLPCTAYRPDRRCDRPVSLASRLTPGGPSAAPAPSPNPDVVAGRIEPWIVGEVEILHQVQAGHPADHPSWVRTSRQIEAMACGLVALSMLALLFDRWIRQKPLGS